MKKFILASVSALALLGVAACSDNGADNTTTQSTNPPAAEQPVAPDAMVPSDDTVPPATDNSTTQGIVPAPNDGTTQDSGDGAMAPAQPAPAVPVQ